ncbi:MAG: mechanosensitive ion channel family protein [Candidatus Aenigmatarchaeota archaeon]|nr:MAG: mechanosensitive ion channel family protein [Candidatus Aenigmarchaeota archaeon]
MVLEFLSPYLGSYFETIRVIIIIVISLFVAKAINFFLDRGIRRLTEKTKTTLDDKLVHAIRKPILLGALLTGVYFSLHSLSYLSGYAALINQAFTVVFVLFVSLFLVRTVNAVIEWYGEEILSKTKAQEQMIPIFRKIAYIVIGLIALLWLMNQLGIQITTLVTTLGIGGLAIALALQDTLKEFFAGMYIMADRPIKIGDYIELDSGQKGFVEDIGWRTTKIKMLGNNRIIIPNSKLSSSIITNYYAPTREMSVVVPVGVGYGSDLEKVEKITIDVAKKVLKKTDGAVENFEPFIRYKEFGDSNINFSVILRVKKYVNKYKLTHEFIKALKKRYDKEGIEIAWPIRKVYFAKKKVD